MQQKAMRRSIAGVGLSLSLALLCGTVPASAQDKTVELRFSHWVPPSHPMHPSAVAWSESIAKASNGSIKITVFPSQQLGKAFDHYDMARDGIADIAHVNPGYEPGRFPIMGGMELPFLFSNAKEGSAAIDEWYRKYASKEMPQVRYCLTFAHDPGTLHSVNKKVLVPADVKGMKVRPANATIARFVSLLGGAVVQSSAPEARELLSKGVADAITFPWGSIVLFGIDKVVKYHVDAAFYVTEQTWVLNKAKYDAMSPAQKKVMDDHCTSEWALKIATPWADFEAGGREKMKAEGNHEYNALTPAQLAEWRKAAEPLQAEWAAAVKKAGHDPDAVMADLKQTIAKYKSTY